MMLDAKIHTILVINALNGVFPLVLKKRYPSAKITCAEVFPFYKHHLINLGFEVIDWKDTSDMKFDLVIGNPPYQLTNSKKLWPDFINKGVGLLNPHGFLAMVVPSTWLTSDGAAYKKIRQVLTADNNLIIVNRDANDYFDVGQDICYLIAKAEPYQNVTEYVDNSHKSIINLPDGIPKTAQQQAIDTIVDKMLAYQPKIWWELNERDDCIKSSDLNPNQTSVFKYKVYQSTANIGYVKKEPVDFGKLKLAVNFSSSFYNPNSVDFNMPITKDGVGSLMGYILIKSKKQGELLRAYLCSKAVRFLVSNYKKSHTGFNTAVKKRMIPLVPEQNWTDQQLYDHFGFTPSEVNLIENMIK